MYNKDTEMLFPLRVMPFLLRLRDAEWDALISRLMLPDASLCEQLAFVLLMVRLGGCVNCNIDSYRAMRGCTQCAKQTVRRYKASSRDLIGEYEASKKEVELYLKSRND